MLESFSDFKFFSKFQNVLFPDLQKRIQMKKVLKTGNKKSNKERGKPKLT
jgi:hypothetical protein